MLAARLRSALPAGADLTDDLAARLAWANDASIYRLVPQVVVFPRHAEDVQAVLAVARAARVPVCFRAGGTSLSGQAVTDGILLVVSRHLRAIAVAADAASVACGPGAVGAWVNAALAPHGRRIGPDPASIQAAEVAGIVANNASGMCCGVHENSYRTVTGLDLILADGFRCDTGAPDADERLRRERPQIAAGLERLAADLAADPALAAQVARAFATKNTVGYSLNALLDGGGPAAILQRLVVGSEGTLAFINQATFRTLPLPRHRATALLLFRDVEGAGAAVAPLEQSGAAAIELMDDVALRRVADKLPHALPAGEPAALLVEYQDPEAAALDARLAAADPVLRGFDLAAPASFTRDGGEQARLWAARKGLFPSVGAIRKAGTAVVIEDVTFPVARMAEGVRALRSLFAAHGYDDAVVFGHAKDGNLHFTLTPDLGQEAERTRYDGFMRALVGLVLGMDGHLKAEHGTGRNMAPFVEAQWGAPAVALMRRIKALLDPDGILNPGVLLSDDPQAHLQHLKTLGPADPLVDKCIECGFCEPVCPSRDHRVSPRQRIVLLRAAGSGDAAAVAAVQRVRQDWILDGCAADGLCGGACPVGIDTGVLVKAERAAGNGALAHGLATISRKHLSLVIGVARLGMRVTGGWRLPGRAIPVPPAAPALPRTWPAAAAGQPTVVYAPTCLTRMMGGDPVAADLAALCRAAGIGLVVPAGIASQCCGQPWTSKGFPADGRAAREAFIGAVLGAAEGTAGVLIDTSLCLAALDGKEPVDEALLKRWKALKRWHPASFTTELLFPRLAGRWKAGGEPAVVHPTCSEQKLGWVDDLRAAASPPGSPAAVVPRAAGCCGMAGDRGWLVPGLSRAATAREAAEVQGQSGHGVTTSATCALAIGAGAGRSYGHLFSFLRSRLV
ncbi:MAG: FAD-binding oxidoreductase [Planctomycetes bacterium]|nr:FAD-binding oxidoreductase [Planctomycetota bacterium]